MIKKISRYFMTKIGNYVAAQYADPGPVTGLYNTGETTISSIHELVRKKHFALEIPAPSQKHIESLPDVETLVELFKRPIDRPAPEERVSLLLPFFAQHLTDAVFQSVNQFETDAPHEIVLNQIYGNAPETTQCLRLGNMGKLKSQFVKSDGRDSEFPPSLLEKGQDGNWQIKDEFKAIDYLNDPGHISSLLESYKGRESEVCALGLFQGNMTVGNFALTTLFLREHNRLCDEIADEFKRKKIPDDDNNIFVTAAAVNILQYMRIVVEDYVNGFAGFNIFNFDTKSFFYEKRRWCRASPIPFHFNVLYRLHSMIPNELKLLPDQGFLGFLANNGQVVQHGLGKFFEEISKQPSSCVSLGNTHEGLLAGERAMITKARTKLAPFANYRKHEGLSNDKGFDVFAKEDRATLRQIYGGDYGKVDYAVGIYAEARTGSIVEKMGIKKHGFLGETLLRSIAKHAVRHVFSNPLMRREFLNPGILSDVGWESLRTIGSVQDLVRRNTPELEGKSQGLQVSMDAPAYR